MQSIYSALRITEDIWIYIFIRFFKIYCMNKLPVLTSAESGV